MTSSISYKAVESLYSNLRPLADRGGFEVTRTSGTSGFVSHQSHKDLLFVLRENDGLLPNKAGACLILPHEKQYYILYSKHKVKDGKHPIGITTYAPPKPGGSLMINGNALDEWPILGEFAYAKMICTLTLKRLNEFHLQSGLCPVATGPIQHEMKSIAYSCQTFQFTKSYKSFCKAFISVNIMSLVAWPVGQHNDHFNKGESRWRTRSLLWYLLLKIPWVGVDHCLENNLSLLCWIGNM